ncbi:MAG: hypothetical protein ACR2QR_03480 [Woeseiaceae bacterium]
MTLQDWGALGELVGGVAIIVSLLYVGLQIRHSAGATRAATNQAFIAQYNDLLYQLTRAEVRDIYWRGLPGLTHLQGSELACFSGLMAMIFRTYEIFYLEKSEGRFDSKMWRGYTALLRDLMSNTGPREYWELRKHQYSDEFVELMESDIMARGGVPLYPQAS